MNNLASQRLDLQELRQWTEARIALGRVGASMPTAANLEFSADHAAARDAVHAGLDVASLKQQLETAGFAVVAVRSRAENRAEYLQCPELGRRLNAASAERLRSETKVKAQQLTVVIADGLSAEAPMRYALPLLIELRTHLLEWNTEDIVLAEQARVALGDEIGELRRSEAVLVLLGERPGLKAADSLGAYLTYGPHLGTTDSSRNCVSNIRRNGLSVSAAVTKLVYLLHGARVLGRSGVVLKDNSELPHPSDHNGQLDGPGWKGLLDTSAGSLKG